MKHFVYIQKGRIFYKNRPFHLKGVNLGGWLMPEGYIVYAPNQGYRFFREKFIKVHGQKELYLLEKAFRDVFIQEKDFALIAKLGCNSIRLPFHYQLIEESPYVYSQEGVSYLDRAISWAKKYGIGVILDLHAAVGAQNEYWHSDSDGSVKFFHKSDYQKRMCALWQFLANRYRDQESVIGYDLLNETVIDDSLPLNQYYHMAIKAIRSVDKQHLIFVEGNRWAQDIKCLDCFDDEQLILGIHFYEPLEFTFNFIPGLSYPLLNKKKNWDKKLMAQRLDSARMIAQKRQRPLWCGEFGVQSRGGLYGEDRWVKDILSYFHQHEIHWHYWTWKAVKHTMFPDGIYQYFPNDPWINRCGPLSGWDTWIKEWPTQSKQMIASWDTRKFVEDKSISVVLKNGLK